MKNPNISEDDYQVGLEKYKALYENGPLPYQSLDVDGCFIDVNPAFLNTLGYERDEIIGKFFGDFLHPDSKIHFKKNFSAFKRLGHVSNVEFKIQHKKGHWLDVSFEGNIAYHNDGSFKQTYCAFQDITTRQGADRALRENEKLLRTIAENYPNSYISIIEKDLTVSFASGQEFKNRNLDPEQFKGLTVNQIFGKQAAIVKNNYKKTFNGEACSFELFIDEQHQLYRTVPLVSDDGAIHRILTVVENITQRINAEKAFLESERRLSTLMDNLPGMAYRCHNDPNWTMEFISSGCMTLTGYKPSDLLGNQNKAYSELIHPDDRTMVWASVQNSLAKKEPYEMEYRIIDAEGKKKFVLEMGTGIIEGKQIEFLEGFIMDITERKHAEEKNQRNKDQLEELVMERTKDIEAKNQELERFNKLFVGREFRIKELREKIKALEKRLQNN